MTGSWAGPAGEGRVLEENWISATDGTIASLVRMTGGGDTSMVELIVIEEQGDSLVLYLKQWDPGFKPRTEGPSVMDLVELGERRVSFKAREPAGMATLTYSSPTPDSFNIAITTPDGNAFTIPLSAR